MHNQGTLLSVTKPQFLIELRKYLMPLPTGKKFLARLVLAVPSHPA
jgi:hypothetical protein